MPVACNVTEYTREQKYLYRNVNSFHNVKKIFRANWILKKKIQKWKDDIKNPYFKNGMRSLTIFDQSKYNKRNGTKFRQRIVIEPFKTLEEYNIMCEDLKYLIENQYYLNESEKVVLSYIVIAALRIYLETIDTYGIEFFYPNLMLN